MKQIKERILGIIFALIGCMDFLTGIVDELATALNFPKSYVTVFHAIMTVLTIIMLGKPPKVKRIYVRKKPPTNVKS